MHRLVLLSFLLLWNTGYSAECVNDHLSSRWKGNAWTPNRLMTPHLAVNGGLFPLVTKGGGSLALPESPLLLRFHLFISPGAPNQSLARIRGRVAEDKDTDLGELVLTNGCLALICFANPKSDSLFDCAADIWMQTPCKTNLWISREIHINPLPYQQTLGWQTLLAAPKFPERDKPPYQIVRQPSKAQWRISHIQIPLLNRVVFGGFELGMDLDQSRVDPFNILRVKGTNAISAARSLK